MKLNRRALRRMIMESIMREHRVAPDPQAVPPQYLDKIHSLIDSGELKQAQSFIDAFGGPESYVDDYIAYQEVGDLEKLGNQARVMYATSDDPNDDIHWASRRVPYVPAPGYTSDDIASIKSQAYDLSLEKTSDHEAKPYDSFARFLQNANKPIYQGSDTFIDDPFLDINRKSSSRTIKEGLGTKKSKPLK